MRNQAASPSRAAATSVKKAKPASKLSFKEQRELEELPKRIEMLERWEKPEKRKG